MSSASQPGYDTISYINFTGGFPSNVDFAPSIVFLVAYALTCPILLWRLFRKQDRTVVLIRPSIFYACRIAMLIVRAIMAKTTYQIGLLIAELVFVSVGFLFLIDPLIALWKRHVSTHVPRAEQPKWVLYGTWILRLLLITSILTAVIASSLTSQAFYSQGARNAVRALRETSYILSLAVVVCLLAALIWSHLHFALPVLKTVYLLVPSACLLVVAVYRVAQTYSTNPDAAARGKAAFWILQVLFEFIAYSFIIGVSIPQWYPGDQAPKQSKTSSRYHEAAGVEMKNNSRRGDVESGQRQFRARPWYLKGPITRLLTRGRYDD